HGLQPHVVLHLRAHERGSRLGLDGRCGDWDGTNRNHGNVLLRFEGTSRRLSPLLHSAFPRRSRVTQETGGVAHPRRSFWTGPDPEVPQSPVCSMVSTTRRMSSRRISLRQCSTAWSGGFGRCVGRLRAAVRTIRSTLEGSI